MQLLFHSFLERVVVVVMGEGVRLKLEVQVHVDINILGVDGQGVGGLEN